MKEERMTERAADFDTRNFDSKDLQVRVEFGGLAGIARIVRIGGEALRWHVTMLAENGRSICDFDGPEVYGEDAIIPSINDIENAQHEINKVINQFLWDPMSRA
jgi:hypothetical protein